MTVVSPSQLSSGLTLFGKRNQSSGSISSVNFEQPISLWWQFLTLSLLSDTMVAELQDVADRTSQGALVQKYEAGLRGFFKDEDAVLQFAKKETVREKLSYVWGTASMQVREGGGALWAILGSHAMPTSCLPIAPS